MSGVKRHIAVDTAGRPHAIHVTAASISGKAGALEMIRFRESSLFHVAGVLCDGGYAGKALAGCVKETIGAHVEVIKSNNLHTFKVLPRRWIVERSFGRPDKGRRLWKNCERRLHMFCQNGGFCFYRFTP